ncbi:hypothetical protein PR048_021993 [Dryococelus australis]|uniref:THAP-type domain-containing protein n=1 Tax=Dryococelus australis TaxID=614101 RepID=A0ABQ9GZZ0_9NEOP|nr:hypothetical protein PR048_021993 [Dryococelus australis]
MDERVGLSGVDCHRNNRYGLCCTDTVPTRHRFPVYEEDAFKIWIARIKSDKLESKHPLDAYKSFYVCGRHFLPACTIPGSKRLKHYALPTVNLPGATINSEEKSKYGKTAHSTMRKPRECSSIVIIGDACHQLEGKVKKKLPELTNHVAYCNSYIRLDGNRLSTTTSVDIASLGFGYKRQLGLEQGAVEKLYPPLRMRPLPYASPYSHTTVICGNTETRLRDSSLNVILCTRHDRMHPDNVTATNSAVSALVSKVYSRDGEPVGRLKPVA